MSLSTIEVANRLAELVKAGDYETPYGELYSPEIVSVEGGPSGQVYTGMAAIEAKNQWWQESMEVHSLAAEGPFPSQDKFGMIYEMDVTEKASGQRFVMKELAIYTVVEGKITHEQFFYSEG